MRFLFLLSQSHRKIDLVMKNLIAIFVCVLIAGCDINAPEKMPSSPTPKPIEIPWKKVSDEYYTLNLLDGREFEIVTSSSEVLLILNKGRLGSRDIIGTYNSVDEAKKAFRVLYKLEKALVEQ